MATAECTPGGTPNEGPYDPHMAEWHPAPEEYCEAVYEIGEDDMVVVQARLAERFLTDMLKLSWAEAHHEAGKWEHIISDRVESALEFAPGRLEFLDEAGVLPGRTGTVTAASPDGTVTVQMDNGVVGIGTFAPDRILVEA